MLWYNSEHTILKKTNIFDTRRCLTLKSKMPVTKVYPGGSVVDGEVVESTREVTMRFMPDMNVNGTTTTDGRHMFSVFEFINGASGKTGEYADAEWRRMRHSPLKTAIRQMKAGWLEADLGEMTSVKVRKRSMYKHIFVKEPAMTVKGLMWLLEQLDGVDAWTRERLLVPLTDYAAGARGMVTPAPGLVTAPTQRTVNRRERAKGAPARPSKATVRVAARRAQVAFLAALLAAIAGASEEAGRDAAAGDPLFADAKLAAVKQARDTTVNAVLRLREEAVGAKRKRAANAGGE